MQYANTLLNQFKGNDQAWMTVDKILELSQDNNVKFFALQILDEAINVSCACNQQNSLINNLLR